MTESVKFHLSIRALTNFLLLLGFTFIVLLIRSDNAPIKKNLGKEVQAKTGNSIVETCSKNQNYECFKEAFIGYYDENGPAKTLTTLQELSTNNEFIKRDCHPYAHELGQYSYKQIGDALEAFSYGSTICASGYFHGVMEGYLSKVRDQNRDLKTEIVGLCDSKNGENRFMSFQCLHGMGHGLTMYSLGDIYKGLNYCDQLRTEWEQQSCYGGVFMENIVVKDIPGHQSLFLKSDQPEYPCNEVEEKYKFSCYFLSSSWFLQVTNYDYGAAFTLCDNVNKNYVWVCYQSMGRDISGSTLRNPDRSLELCNQGQKQYLKDCIIGVAKDFTNTTASPTEVAAFCHKISNDNKETCYRAASSILVELHPNRSGLEKDCEVLTRFDKNFKEVCVS